MLAEEFFRAELAACPVVVAASSEEDPVETDMTTADVANRPEDVYAVAFDPLDGSSIVGANWSVGCIFGVWAGRSALGKDPREQVAAVLGVFGPRTTAVVAVRIPGREADAVCVEVGIDESGHGEGSCDVIRSDLRLNAPGQSKTRYFAPANLRAAAEDEKYMSLVTKYIQDKYTLRYSGGLVPDVVHGLVNGHGVYLSPVTAGSKAKLRRAFEVLPVALVVECAGGMAIDPADGRRILETPLASLDEKSGLVCGTAEEVEKVKAALLG